MADLPNRDELEALLARKLGKANREALNSILDELGDPPDLSKLTEDKWIRIRQLFEAATIGALEATFIASVDAAMGAVGVGVDWALINERAAGWATQYGFDLVRDITDKRRRFLQRSIDDFYRTGMTMGDLRERLSREFGAVRADMIAATETTRAAVEGERAYVNELRKQGARLKNVVQNSADDRVCPICSPKQGKDPDEVGYPPYHIKCRCWFSSEALVAA